LINSLWHPGSIYLHSFRLPSGIPCTKPAKPLGRDWGPQHLRGHGVWKEPKLCQQLSCRSGRVNRFHVLCCSRSCTRLAKATLQHLHQSPQQYFLVTECLLKFLMPWATATVQSARLQYLSLSMPLLPDFSLYAPAGWFSQW